MIYQQRGMNGLSRLGVWDTETMTYTDDDGSTFTVAETVDDYIAVASPATDLPVMNIPAGTTPPEMTYDPGKLIRAGAEIYRYIQKTNAQGQKVYVPQRYMTMQTRQPEWLLPALLAAAIALLA